MTTSTPKVSPHDKTILRDLARRYREACDSPRNQELRRLWYLHDQCRGERPLILTETDAGHEMVLPDYRPRCQEQWARQQEAWLTDGLMHIQIIGDDWPIEPFVSVRWQVRLGDYGVAPHSTTPTTDGTRGAYHIDAVITDLERDFHRLRPRDLSVDRDATLALKAALEETYDGILGVRLRGHPWWTMGLTMDAIYLIGLENLMLFMYDQPAGLHRLMAFLRDEHLRLAEWMEAEGLLTLNNENDYVGSGSRGYTRDLPAPGHDGRVRLRDTWALIESQESVGVGPAQYAEFIFPYEESIARRFGKVYYGCCEPVHTRWDVLKHMSNLHRVSVSPWCDQAQIAPALAGRHVFSRKPNPSLVSTERFDEDLIRQDVRHTMQLARQHGCTLEVVMKDVHTLRGEPDRLTRWTRLARQAAAEVYA